jgi:dienelactone hydrolase
MTAAAPVRFRDRVIEFGNGAVGRVVGIASANPRNYFRLVSDPTTMPRIDVDGQLFLPPRRRGRVPLVIVVPGSLSVAPSHLAHAEAFTDLGFASFVLDPFGARNVVSTVANQTQYSFAASAYDVMAAVRQLGGRDEIDAARIGLQGHSRGGSAVLSAAMQSLNRSVFGTTHSIRSVLAAYPWCGHQPLEPHVGNTEIRVVIGARDDWVSPLQAQSLVQAIRLTGGRATIRIVPDAAHSFDRREPLQYFADAATAPYAPVTYLADNGAFVDPDAGHSDPTLTDYDIAVHALKSGFGKKGATIGSQGDQAELFRADMIAFFQRTLGNH